MDSLLSAEKPNERDSACYALKTIISEMPSTAAELVTKSLLPRLSKELAATGRSHEVKVEIMEILNVAISQYSSLFSTPTLYLSLESALLEELSSRRKNNRKRATQCLGEAFT